MGTESVGLHCCLSNSRVALLKASVFHCAAPLPEAGDPYCGMISWVSPALLRKLIVLDGPSASVDPIVGCSTSIEEPLKMEPQYVRSLCFENRRSSRGCREEEIL